jgi:hypothetical protein
MVLMLGVPGYVAWRHDRATWVATAFKAVLILSHEREGMVSVGLLSPEFDSPCYRRPVLARRGRLFALAYQSRLLMGHVE